MPNGTSGTLYVKRADLVRLIDEIGEHLVIGEAVFDQIKGSLMQEPVTGLSLKEIIRASDPASSCAPRRGDDVFATEQDHDHYILHLNTWVSVDKASPLFEGLDRIRQDWLRQMLERARHQ